MNKKLLTIAIGATLSTTSLLTVQADVKVGGHAQVEAYSASAACTLGTAAASTIVGSGMSAVTVPATGIFSGSGICATTNAAGARGQGLIDNARGRFWITADEDLGAGFKGLAHFEFSVDTANSAQSVAGGSGASPYDATARTFDQRTREKYVGLSGGFGALKFGNNHGAYKRMGGTRWDPFNATVLEARGNGGQSGSADVNASFAHNGFVPGSIKWESGKLLGEIVTVEVLYAPHKNSNGQGDTGTGDDYQVGVSVKPIKDLEIIAAHSNNQAQPDNTIAIPASQLDQKATKVGARLGFLGMHTLFAQYEMVDMNDAAAASVPTSAGITTATAADGTFLFVGYSLKFGNFNWALQGGRHNRDLSSAIADLQTDYAATGITYNFSKTTRSWLGYRKSTASLDRNAAGDADSNEAKVVALGLRKDF